MNGDLIQAIDARRRLRTRATWKVVAGSLGAAAAFLLFRYLYWKEGFRGGPEALVFALPGALALAGVLELVSGTPLSEWSRRWDSLKGWQRGLLGAGIWLLALAAFVVGVVFWLEHQE